jgi:hypothetical protein
MSTRVRQLGLFGVAGVLVATLIIAGFIIGGNVFQVSGKGVLTVQIMDKPVELPPKYDNRLGENTRRRRELV